MNTMDRIPHSDGNECRTSETCSDDEIVHNVAVVTATAGSNLFSPQQKSVIYCIIGCYIYPALLACTPLINFRSTNLPRLDADEKILSAPNKYVPIHGTLVLANFIIFHFHVLLSCCEDRRCDARYIFYNILEMKFEIIYAINLAAYL